MDLSGFWRWNRLWSWGWWWWSSSDRLVASVVTLLVAPWNHGLLSMSDHISLDANTLLRKLQEVSSGRFAVFDDLPFLLDCHLVDQGEGLVKLNISDDRDLSVAELWDMDLSLNGG